MHNNHNISNNTSHKPNDQGRAEIDELCNERQKSLSYAKISMSRYVRRWIL